jgi:hypothetical protein
MTFDDESQPADQEEPQEDDGLHRCKICRVSEKDKYLTQCSICKQYFCDPDAFSFGGKQFCTKVCADYFFFGEEEE